MIDPLGFKSWEDAFNYPLPNIRQFENRLRSHAEDGRQKLRGMVGASYRKLLETADEITEMKDVSEDVEAQLGRVGLFCSSRYIEKLQQKADLQAKRTGQGANDHSRQAAEVSLLESCAAVLIDLSSHRGSLLLAAKVLVLARLTMTTTSRRSSSMPFLATLRSKLTASRRSLLTRLDRRIGSTKISQQALVDDLCAYALATNAAPKDMLRHLLKTRLDAIRDSLQGSGSCSKCITRALRLLVKTIQDLPAIFTRYMPQGLTKLRAEPILKQEDVRAIHRLRLGVVERWLPEELHNYRPWFRQEDLQRDAILSHAKTWAEKAIDVFLTELPDTLERLDHLEDVTSTRKHVLETWTRLSRRSLPLDCKAVQDGLRNGFVERSKKSIRKQVLELQKLSVSIEKLASKSQAQPGDSEGHSSLWSTSTQIPDTKISKIKEAAISGVHGGKGHEGQILQDFADWRRSVGQMTTALRSMQSEKWADDFSESSDDDTNSEEPSDINIRDADTLLAFTNETIKQAFGQARRSLEELVSTISKADSTAVPTIISLTRVISRLGTPAYPVDGHSLIQEPLAHEAQTIEPLWNIIIDHVLGQLNLVKTPEVLARGISKSIKAMPLWEGNPSLPTQPSPFILRFLKAMSFSMASCGLDIWGSGLKRFLKNRAGASVSEAVDAWVNTSGASGISLPVKQNGIITNGDGHHPTDSDEETKATTEVAEPDTAETEAATQETTRVAQGTQLMFDLYFLMQPLGSRTLAPHVDTIAELIKASDTTKSHLEKGAKDYWKKTYLLFALLQ